MGSWNDCGHCPLLPSQEYEFVLHVTQLLWPFHLVLVWLGSGTIQVFQWAQIQPLARLLFNPNQQVLASVNSAFPTVRPKSMAGNASSSLTLVFLIILIAAPTASGLFFPTPFVVSLGHSLMTRVANLRASRGDHSGAERARAVAATLEQLELALRGMKWPTGWDYFRNYPWGEMKGAVPEMKELLRWMTELSRTKSGAERAAWVVQNYQSVLTVSNSMLGKLLQEFRQSGALREVVETLKKEVTEGELLRDCLELVSNDWKGLIQVLNDHLSQSSSDSTSASGHTAEL